jgi:kynurenine formamidase
MRKVSGLILAATLMLGSMAARADGLWAVSEMLHAKKWVDLTHPFDGAIPHWKGFDPMTRKVIYDYDKDGFRAELFCHVGQWGTHIDPPAHFHRGTRTVDGIPVTQMLLPLVVIDVHRQAAENPDFVLTLKHVRAWEARHGAIPKGAFVAMRTDWSKRWPDQHAMQNVDAQGTAHYPGWTMEALKYLYEVRLITASGHETTDTDPGTATTKDDYSLESYILGLDHYQIELLANLDQVPETGALVSVTWPDVKDGTGFPARVFAILP